LRSLACRVSATRLAERPVTRIRPSKGWFDLALPEVWRHRELLWQLMLRELKIRYKQAALGVTWAILQPLLPVVVFTVIFGGFARFPSGGMPYSVFSLAGVLPWTYFAEALRRSATGLVTNSELVRKVYFPRLAIPLAGVASPIVDFGFGLLLLFPLMAWYGMAPTWSLLTLPLWMLLTLAFALALGLWLGPLNVRYRDIMHTLPFVIQIWMYATPIVYPLSMVPEKWRSVYSLNPMVGIIEGFRWSLLGTGHPDMRAVSIAIALITIALLGGLIYFRKVERSFADVI
jgi:lipopolysaccharide transport system permease protein